MKRKPLSRKRYMIVYERGGVELERFVIEADNLDDAEVRLFVVSIRRTPSSQWRGPPTEQERHELWTLP
jgi:hypothetical protein